MKKNLSARVLAGCAVLIALNIVITRLLSVTVGPVRIGFGFITIAFGSMLYGPVLGTVSAVVADVLGAVMQGTGYWLGFGLSTALYGMTYAFFLYRREKSYKNITACVILQAIVIDAFLGALWYTLYAGMPFWTALTGRSINALIMIPVKIVMLKYAWIYIGNKITNTQN